MRKITASVLSALVLILFLSLNLFYFKIQPFIWLKFLAMFVVLLTSGKGFGKILGEYSGKQEHELLGIPLFFLLSSLITWIVNVVFQGSAKLPMILMMGACSGYLLIKLINLDRKDLIKRIQEKVSLHAVGLIIFFLFLLMSSFHLNLNTGEKPMDFGILNYFYLHEKGQPTDIWAARSGFSYYYLGFFAWAKWLKLFTIGTDYGFPFAFALTVWMFFLALYALFKIVFKRNILHSILMSLFVLFIPSFQVIKQIFTGKKWDFPFYWSSTRVFKENLFSEFPIWSFSFGDFHPHVMNYPFAVTFLALILSFESFQKISLKNLIFVILVGASLTMVNIWEGIFLTFFCGLYYLWSFSQGEIKKSYQKMVLNPMLGAFIGMIAILPWLKTLLIHSGSAGQFGINRAPSNGVWEYYLLFGTIDLIFLFSTIVLISKKVFVFDKSRILAKSWLAIFYLPAFALGVMNPDINSKILTILLLLGVFFSIFLMTQKERSFVLAGLICLTGLTLVQFGESLIILDRINSLFKTNTFNFLILSISAAFIFMAAIDQFNVTVRTVLGSSVLIFFCFTSFVLGKSIHTISYTAGKEFKTPLEHFRKRFDGDYEVILWLRANSNVNEVVLEYFGAPYKYDTARISTYSGVPSYLGWAGQHVTQRGLSYPELERRKIQSKRIYASLEVDQIHQLLIKEKIDYVVTGRFESKNVSSPGLDKFDKAPDKFQKVVHHLPSGTRLYKIMK